jgi:uncharacterized small protein (DUF1192 family)
MPGPQWLTYDEAATRLGISGTAIRRRAARGRWARMLGNDGCARIQVPEEVTPPRRGTGGSPGAPSVGHRAPADTAPLVASLEAHIATLKSDIDRLTAELAGERAGRQADRDLQGAHLAAARAAADKATAELVALAQRLAAIAEAQQAPDVSPEPRRSRAARAWGWFLRN